MSSTQPTAYRQAPVRGPGNYRDLGGAPCHGGTVRKGLIMRGALHRGMCLSGVKDPANVHLFDLRRLHEAQEGPHDACHHRWPLHDPQWVAAERTPRFYIDSSLRLVPLMSAVLADALSVLASGGRVYVGCRLGKDRTGLLVLLLGRALRVDDEALVADYARTAEAYLNAPEWVARYAGSRGEEPGSVMARLTPAPDIPLGILERLPASPGELHAALGIRDDVLEAVRQAVVRPPGGSVPASIRPGPGSAAAPSDREGTLSP